MSMDSEKKMLLAWIERETGERIHEKFIKGDRDHKGDLYHVDLLEEAIDELIDGVIYLLVLKAKLDEEKIGTIIKEKIDAFRLRKRSPKKRHGVRTQKEI